MARDILVLLLSSSLSWVCRAQTPGCHTGAQPLAEAYIRANPVYSNFYNSLESYVTEHREQFAKDGDAVRCAAALADAFLTASSTQYFIEPLRSRTDQSPLTPTATELFGMIITLRGLARVLPPAAAGNFGPLRTPTNELEATQLQYASQFHELLTDPERRKTLEPFVKQAAELDRRTLLDAANRLEFGHIVALLDTARHLYGTTGGGDFMFNVATTVSEYPDSVRGPTTIRSLDDASRALEATLLFFGKAMAVVVSVPPGPDWRATFRRVYAVGGNEFTINSGDSSSVDPASYDVTCKHGGSEPLSVGRQQCYSRCHIVCEGPRRVR